MSEQETEVLETGASSKVNQLDDLDRHARLSILAIGLVAFLMLFAYFVKFSGYGFSGKQEDWGVFGDYLGGVLNPTISLAALYWLTRSISLQKRELQESREALIEAAYSQSKQAKSSEIAAKLQLLSIEMEIVSAQLANEAAYQMQLLLRLDNGKSDQEIYDRKGNLRRPPDVIKEVHETISKLSSRREGILRAAKKLEPKFEIEIMLAKSY